MRQKRWAEKMMGELGDRKGAGSGEQGGFFLERVGHRRADDTDTF